MPGMKKQFQVIGDIRGIGLLWGIELVTNPVTKERATLEAEKIMYECMRKGLSFKVSHGNIIQLSPPLTITRAELQRAIDILYSAFQTVSNKTYK